MKVRYLTAARLSTLRLAKGVSTEEMALNLEVPESTVKRWEKKGIKRGLDTLIKLAEYFDVTVDFLLELKKD